MTSQQAKHSRQTTAVLAGILMLAAGLRFFALDGQSFWADEGNSVVLAGRSVAAILQAAAADIHPPAYYLLLKAWGALFGLGETGARSLSALLGVLVVVAMLPLARRLFDNRTAILAALLAAANPFLVYYSQEARMYELLTLAAVLSTLAVLQWLQAHTAQERRRALFLYTPVVALGLYTHYAFPLHVLVLNFVVGLWWLRQPQPWRQRLPALRAWVLAQVGALALFAPWLPIALRQLGTWPSPPTSLGPLDGLRQALGLWQCGPIPCEGTIILLAMGALLLLPGLLGLAWQKAEAWLLPLWLMAPLLAMVAFGIFSPAFFKFLLIATPAFILLQAGGLRWLSAHLPAGLPRLSLTLLLLAILLIPNGRALARYYTDPAVARDDYRSIAAYIRSLATPSDAVILTAPGQIDAFSQYDHGPAPVYPLPRSRPIDPEATVAELRQIIEQHQRLYAIFWASEQADPQGVIERTLAEHSFKAWDSWVGHLRFVAYSAEPAPPPRPLPAAIAFGQTIRLQAVGLSDDALHPGDIARVLLQWQAAGVPQRPYKVTLQLLDPAMQVFAQVDSEPVAGARPFTSWQAGAVVRDPYGLAIPLATPPGDYPLILAVYDPESGQRLPVRGDAGDADHVNLGVFHLQAPAQAPPLAVLPIAHRSQEERGPLVFLGHNRYKQGYGHAPDTPLHPGDLLHLTLFWQTNEPLSADYIAEIRLDGQPLARLPLVGPGYPSSAWLPGLPWRGEHSIPLPPELANGGTHDLSLQIMDAAGQPLGAPISLTPPLRY